MLVRALPRLYDDLAAWWPLLSNPDDYAAEAEFCWRCITEASRIPVRTVLELGSGGGNNASHLKARCELTLVDLSPAMLRVSRSLNPECEHVHGDMREVRLGRRFDAVFVHSAVAYMLSETDLTRAMETAWIHLQPGGAALFCPNDVAETFKAGTYHGGHDRMLRSLRYLEWVHEPAPGDTLVTTDFAYILQDKDGIRMEYDRHVTGLFPRAKWLGLLQAQGFTATTRERAEPATSGPMHEVFVATRPE
ncbi:MAG TPA: class I SAM-dependent methyltransferase [bacterium]|nr:class I SAM-dependent methyltransferase [bacterium]